MKNWEAQRRQNVENMMRFERFKEKHIFKFYLFLAFFGLTISVLAYMPYYKCEKVCEENGYVKSNLVEGGRFKANRCFCQTEDDCISHRRGKQYAY